MGRRYTVFIVVGSSLASVFLSLAVSFSVAQRAAEAERHAREEAAAERQRAAEASRYVLCQVVTRQESVFTDAETQVGRNAAAAWHDLGVTFGCY